MSDASLSTPVPLPAGAAGGPDPVPGAALDAGLAPPRVLLLPGWLDSGPTHWQSRWEARFGDRRVVQAEWEHPLRGDWMARLDEVVADLPPGEEVLLAAHSLGCQLVAAWAAHSRRTGRVRGALLVAPADIERDDAPLALTRWRPVVRSRLPFPAVAVVSSDDPYASVERGTGFARDWGAEVVDAGPRGHLNGDSGLGDWPAGRALLARLAAARAAGDVPDAPSA